MTNNALTNRRRLNLFLLALATSFFGPVALLQSAAVTGSPLPQTLNYTFQIENRTGKTVHIVASLSKATVFDITVPWTPRADPNNPDGPPDGAPARFRWVTVELPTAAAILNIAETEVLRSNQAVTLASPGADLLHDFRIIVLPDHIELHQDLARGTEVPATSGRNATTEALRERQAIPMRAVFIANLTEHPLHIVATVDGRPFFTSDVSADQPSAPAGQGRAGPPHDVPYPHAVLKAPLRYGSKTLHIVESSFFKSATDLDLTRVRRDSYYLTIRATANGFELVP